MDQSTAEFFDPEVAISCSAHVLHIAFEGQSFCFVIHAGVAVAESMINTAKVSCQWELIEGCSCYSDNYWYFISL